MKRALIVDDTKNIRLLLTKYLSLEGYEAVCASTGAEAFDRLREETFDLVFLDIKLPEMSGTEVLRRMNEMGNRSPVIIMTAYATVKNALECTRLGAIAYLQKPFTVNRLHALLGEIEIGGELSDSVLDKAELLIDEGQAGKALELVRENLGRYHEEPRAYRLLARAYGRLGDEEMVKKFTAIADLLSQSPKR